MAENTTNVEDFAAEKVEKEAGVVEAPGDHAIGESELITFTPEEERRVVRKIDSVVLPLVNTGFPCPWLQ